MTNRSRLPLLIAALLPLALVAPRGLATEVEEAASVGELRGSPSAEDRKRAREAELQAIRRSIEVSERRQSSLRDEIAGLESDRAKLSADLIATAQRLRRAEEEIRRIETRLGQLHANEDGIRASLRERRSTMSEVIM